MAFYRGNSTTVWEARSEKRMAQVLSGLKQTRALSKTVNIIGFPINSGQPKPGTELGPSAIRASGLKDKLATKGLSVHDSDDLLLQHNGMNHAITSTARNAAHVSASCQSLSQAVAKSVRQFEKTVVLGGDHSLGMGSIHGHAQADPSARGIAVLWIDAHAGELHHVLESYKTDNWIPRSRHKHGVNIEKRQHAWHACQLHTERNACLSLVLVAVTGNRCQSFCFHRVERCRNG